jgi:hypothetical protein
MEPRQFVCVDCNIHVTTFAGRKDPVEPNLCAVCDFLRTVEDPVEREAMRALLQPKESENEAVDRIEDPEIRERVRALLKDMP